MNIKLPQTLLFVFILAWIFLALEPLRRDVWLLENAVVFLALPLVIWAYRKGWLSNSSYVLIFMFGLLHIIGAHYSYALTPAGEWFSTLLGSERNDYDRLVHLLYGVFGAAVAFDIFRGNLPKKKFLGALFVFSVVLSFGALYEILEYVVGIIVESTTSEEFLAFQGDVWDTQKDLVLEAGGALIGIMMTRVFGKSDS